MNILYWHGYLLSGSGSNIYAFNVVKELSKNNNVFLFSQEKELLKGFDQHWEYTSSGDIKKNILRTQTKNPLINVTPYIGDLLPVFVKDTYKNFTVKTFPELTSSELDSYIRYNVETLKEFLVENKIDLIFCNHLAISPYIMKLATEELGIPYVVVGHGSSLNYTIAVDDRYRDLSAQGLIGCKKVVFQSKYFFNRTLEVYNTPQISALVKEKGAIIPCGINQEVFSHILKKGDFLNLVNNTPKTGFSSTDSRDFFNLGKEENSVNNIIEEVQRISSKVESFSSIDKELHSKLDLPHDGPVIAFVGRFIYSKGPHLFLMTLPYILREFPKAKILLIGSGKIRGVLEVLLSAVKNKNLSLLMNFSEEGQKLEEGTTFDELFYFKCFMEELTASGKIEEYLELASAINMDQIIFTGNLSHELLPTVLSNSDVLVVPSIFPESFGMIAIEGMFLGNAPVTFDHSGLSEVIPLDENKVPFNEKAVYNLANTIIKSCKKDVSRESKDFFKNYATNFSYKKICTMLMDFNS